MVYLLKQPPEFWTVRKKDFLYDNGDVDDDDDNDNDNDNNNKDNNKDSEKTKTT